MRIYTVQPGDSPAGIASRDNMAGCPKCSRDLVLANDHKEQVVHPNGYLSFKEMRVGEQLVLPEKWFEPGFELLPPAYFGSLPYADGVTPSVFGEMAPVILRDFKALDVAANALRALADAGPHMDESSFVSDVGNVAAAINAAYQPALGNVDAAQYVHAGQEALRQVMQAESRTDIYHVLAAALGSAQLAMQKLYATIQPPGHSS